MTTACDGRKRVNIDRSVSSVVVHAESTTIDRTDHPGDKVAGSRVPYILSGITGTGAWGCSGTPEGCASTDAAPNACNPERSAHASTTRGNNRHRLPNPDDDTERCDMEAPMRDGRVGRSREGPVRTTYGAGSEEGSPPCEPSAPTCVDGRASHSRNRIGNRSVASADAGRLPRN